MLLYYMYFKYFDWLLAKELAEMSIRKKEHNVLPAYYQGRYQVA